MVTHPCSPTLVLGAQFLHVRGMAFEPGSGLWIFTVLAVKAVILGLLVIGWHWLFRTELEGANGAKETRWSRQMFKLGRYVRGQALKRSR